MTVWEYESHDKHTCNFKWTCTFDVGLVQIQALEKINMEDYLINIDLLVSHVFEEVNSHTFPINLGMLTALGYEAHSIYIREKTFIG